MLIFLAIPLGVVGALVLFWTLFGLAFGFLALHWADIAIVVGVPVCLVYWLATRKKEAKPVTPPTDPDTLVIGRTTQGLVALAEIVCAVRRDLRSLCQSSAPEV